MSSKTTSPQLWRQQVVRLTCCSCNLDLKKIRKFGEQAEVSFASPVDGCEQQEESLPAQVPEVGAGTRPAAGGPKAAAAAERATGARNGRAKCAAVNLGMMQFPQALLKVSESAHPAIDRQFERARAARSTWSR